MTLQLLARSSSRPKIADDEKQDACGDDHDGAYDRSEDRRSQWSNDDR
jgi:hypothetical protein